MKPGVLSIIIAIFEFSSKVICNHSSEVNIHAHHLKKKMKQDKKKFSGGV